MNESSKRKSIAVIGDARVEQNSTHYNVALKLGEALIDNGYRIITGGMSGIMQATCKGAKNSRSYKEGSVIAIIPGFDPEQCNKFVDVAIPTGLDTGRNLLVANSDAVVAIGGGAGTLSEMAFAWVFKRMIIAYDVEGWSGKLADQKIDKRNRIDWEGDKIFKVTNEKEVIDCLKKYLKYYNERYDSIISYYKGREI